MIELTYDICSFSEARSDTAIFTETVAIKQSTFPSLAERTSVRMDSQWRDSGRTETRRALHPNQPFLGTNTSFKI